MVIFSPQQFANSCGLACMSYILWKSEYDILHENPDMLSIQKLNFIWLYCSEMVELLGRYEKSYVWSEYGEESSSYLEEEGTIIYIEQIDHYLVRLPWWWWDSYRNLKWIPEFWYWKDLPYAPGYIIYNKHSI